VTFSFTYQWFSIRNVTFHFRSQTYSPASLYIYKNKKKDLFLQNWGGQRLACDTRIIQEQWQGSGGIYMDSIRLKSHPLLISLIHFLT
jgi:hypothetical protein